MSHYHVTGFPLDYSDRGESEVSLTLFTRERGKINFAVRGVKKLVSTLRPAIAPHQEGHYFVAERRGADLLTEWEPLRSYREVAEEPGKLAVAGYMARMITVLAPGETPDARIYNIVENIYFLLLQDIKHDIIKTLLEWGLLYGMGMAPPFEVCAECGKDAAGGVWWNIPDGNVYCMVCGDEDRSQSTRLGAEAKRFGNNIAALGEMVAGELPERWREFPGEAARAIEEATAFRIEDRTAFSKGLVRFCRYHLNEEIEKWFVKI